MNKDLVQAVRIIDVFVLGPAMINIGNKIKGDMGIFIDAYGCATIVFTCIVFLLSKVSQKNMVRNIYDKYEIKLALVALQWYEHGDGLSLSLKFIRGHHVSKDFKIDEEWKKL